VLDAAGHSPAVDDPSATVKALLDFWSRRPERSRVAF
jgi:hypothetical protein